MGDFIIRLRAAPGGDPIKALKATLKTAWRQHRLRCLRQDYDLAAAHRERLVGTQGAAYICSPAQLAIGS
jgi:hypothetical protein